MERILGGSWDEQRQRRTSIKWSLWGPEVLPVWVAEMDAAPCPAVVEAVTSAVRRGDTGYAVEGRYAVALAAYARDTWGWEVDTALTMGTADVMIGIEAILRQVTTPGGAIVVSPPTYDSFFGFVATTGRRRLDAPLSPEGRLDLPVLDRAFGEATAGGERAAYLLCNPANPVGTVPTPEELRALAALADEHGVTVVSDEIHAPIVHPGGAAFTSWLTVSDRGFSALSASKAWNLAGFKAALVIAGAGSADDLQGIHEVHTHGVGHIGAIAHMAAFADGRDWLAQVKGELDDNRHLLRRLLSEHLPQVRMRVPDATYLAWLDFRTMDLGEDPAAVIRERAKVAMSSGPNYGAEAGRGFARFNFATSPEIITEAVERMADVAG
ncbi:MAG TPA: aminotransferase class I/II-fold pyridoxal phosphate-dependent enzyme [Phycicoccus sp.]|nr:aminotransferase class I/II-fold pyridoxal phosphate-dependent enzyme [Phycicoccus sp.]